MSGPTGAQNTLQNEQMQFYQQANQEAAQTYSEDQQLLSQMQSIYDPILAKGPNQQGFSTSEVNNLNSQAVEGTAENYSAAAKAVGESTAAQGGGNIALPTGAQTSLKQQVANAAAQSESQQESQIQQADYAQGYAEFQNAGQALATVSGQLSPTAYSAAATSAGNAASNTANEIAQEDDSWINAAIGGASSIASGFAGGFGGQWAKSIFS